MVTLGKNLGEASLQYAESVHPAVAIACRARADTSPHCM
jgi:hypothetical protein